MTTIVVHIDPNASNLAVYRHIQTWLEQADWEGHISPVVGSYSSRQIRMYDPGDEPDPF